MSKVDKGDGVNKEVQLDKEQQRLKYQGMVLRYGNDSLYCVAKANGSCSYREKSAEIKEQMFLSTDGENMD